MLLAREVCKLVKITDKMKDRKRVFNTVSGGMYCICLADNNMGLPAISYVWRLPQSLIRATIQPLLVSVGVE